MSNILQHLALRLAGKFIRLVWSLVSLAAMIGLGYFLGRQWGETQSEPNGMWIGMIIGFVVWSVLFKPKRRRRRRHRHFGGSGAHSDYADTGDWLGGGDDGGGDD